MTCNHFNLSLDTIECVSRNTMCERWTCVSCEKDRTGSTPCPCRDAGAGSHGPQTQSAYRQGARAWREISFSCVCIYTHTCTTALSLTHTQTHTNTVSVVSLSVRLYISVAVAMCQSPSTMRRCIRLKFGGWLKTTDQNAARGEPLLLPVRK